MGITLFECGQEYDMVAAVGGRGLHSSTSQLNLSRFGLWSRFVSSL